MRGRTETAVTVVQLVRFARRHSLPIPSRELECVLRSCPVLASALAEPPLPSAEAALTMSPARLAVDSAALGELWRVMTRTTGRELAAVCARVEMSNWRSLVSLACMAAGDMSSALERMVRYWPLATTAFQWSLTRGAGEVRASAQIVGDSLGAQAGVEYLVTNLIFAGRQLAVGDFAPVEICLPHRPPVSVLEAMRSTCGCEVRSRPGALEILFREEALALALRSSMAPAVSSFVTALAERGLEEAPRSGFADAVRSTIELELAGGRPSASAVADRLGVSPRTLHRRLAVDGATFRAIADVSLRERAERLLAREDITVREVASALGFADASSFHRAYVRWLGRTPRRRGP